MKSRMPYIVSAILLLFTSCVETLDIEIKEEKKLVVNSSFSPNEPWTVFVTKVKNALDRDTEAELITGAKVTIFENNRPVEVLENPGLQSTDGAYRTRTGVKPEVGKIYTVQVEAKDYPIAIASDSVPVPHFSIHNFNHEKDQASGQCVFYLDIIDQSSQKNYYQISLLKKIYTKENQGSELMFSMQEYVPFSIQDLGPLFGDGFEMFNQLGLILDDETMPETIPFKFDQLPAPSQANVVFKYQVEVRAISPAYHKYQKSVVDYSAVSQNPLAHPFNVYSNVIGGAGNFTGYSCKMTEEIEL